jgi:hypothetical protein
MVNVWSKITPMFLAESEGRMMSSPTCRELIHTVDLENVEVKIRSPVLSLLNFNGFASIKFEYL